MFTLKVTTHSNQVWFHCWGGVMSKDEKDAHLFAHIGRARNVAKQRYSRHLGYFKDQRLKGWEINTKTEVIAKEGR